MTLVGWATFFGTALIAAYVARFGKRIHATWLRRSFYVAGPLFPVICYFLWGLLHGCVPIPQGERCYGFAMGFAVFSPFFFAWGFAFIAIAAYVRASSHGRNAV